MDKFKPVTFDPKAHAAKKRTSSDGFREAYDALMEDEFAALYPASLVPCETSGYGLRPNPTSTTSGTTRNARGQKSNSEELAQVLVNSGGDGQN